MNSAKFLAMAGAALLATSALTSAASAQVVYNGQVVTTNTPTVSSTYGGQTIYQPGSVTSGYQKGGATQGYVISPQPAPVPQVMYTETVQEPAYAPQPVYVDEVEELVEEVIVEEPVYVEEQPTAVVTDTPSYTAPTKENAMRLSVGYGYATAGNFNYGIDSSYTSESAVPGDWTAPASDFTEDYWINEAIRHQGAYGSLRADAGNFFVDAAGGVFTATDYAISSTYNLAEAEANGGVAIGPTAWAVDGSFAAFGGLFAYSAGDGIEVDEFDSLTVTANINSTINDFGAAAGYLFNMNNLPVKVGVGVAGKSLSRTTKAEITSELTEVTAGELNSAVYNDHTYTETVSGMYFGPAIRMNYDPSLTQRVGAHFGGTLQALYGNSDMELTQDNGTVSYTAAASDTGILFSGELDAGLSFQASPTMKIGMGVFAGMTSGAPIVTNVKDPNAATEEERLPTLGKGTWSNYGLKGSISASF